MSANQPDGNTNGAQAVVPSFQTGTNPARGTNPNSEIAATQSGLRQIAGRLPTALMFVWACGVAINLTMFVSQYSSSINLPGCSTDGGCKSVWTSPYSQVAGVSVIWWSFGYYAAVGLSLLLARNSVSVGRWLAVCVLTTVGAVAAGWFGYVLTVLLEASCPWCLAVHGINTLLWLMSLTICGLVILAAARIPESDNDDSDPLHPRQFVFAAVAAGVLVSGQGVLFLAYSSEPPLSFARVANIDAVFADVRSGVRTYKGNPTASTRLVMVSCLSCPKCGETSRLLSEWLKELDGAVSVEVRFAPMQADCNPLWKGVAAKPGLRQSACGLARCALAVAAARPEEFADFLDWIYLNAEQAGLEVVTAEARRRVGAEAFQAAVLSKAVNDRMQEDIDLAVMLDIKSVPAVFTSRGRVTGSLNAGSLPTLTERLLPK